MPKASTSDIEIAQRACVMAGCSKISSFDDTDSEVAITLTDIYEDIVEDCLTIHPWRFATFTRPLGPQLDPAPAVNFSHAYALPNDPRPLQVRTLYLGGSLVGHYRLYNEQLWLNGSDSQEPELEALWRMPESQWPPWFRLYAIVRIAGFLAGSITRNGEMANALMGEAERQLARSRTRDSQQQTTQKIRLVKTRSARLGGRPY
jgi:hypothetical protein